MHSCVHACATAAVQLAVYAIGPIMIAFSLVRSIDGCDSLSQKRCLRSVASLLAPFAVPCSACNSLQLFEGLRKTAAKLLLASCPVKSIVVRL